VSRSESSRWQQLAPLTDTDIDERVERANSRGGEISTAAVLRDLRRVETDRQRAEAAPAPTTVVNAETTILHCAATGLVAHLEAGSVDLIYTDPPYGAEFLDCWDQLADFAAHALKPGRYLMTYSGQMFLPDVLARLIGRLEYVWCAAVVHQSSAFQLRAHHVHVGWKPVIVMRKPGRWSSPWWHDTSTEGRREKIGHEWQQSEVEAAGWIDQLTQPGDLVVDPFLGAGTTAAAAAGLGRRFVERLGP
jgi:hypothetical protein